MPANTLLSSVLFSLSAAGVCGASLVALSVPLSAPGGDSERQGRYAILVTNDTSNVPLHVEPRVVFTDIRGVSTVVAHTLFLASNAQSFGGSAAQAMSLVLLLSGQDALVPLEVLAGSALQVVLMVASNPASATVVSGMAQLWRV